MPFLQSFLPACHALKMFRSTITLNAHTIIPAKSANVLFLLPGRLICNESICSSESLLIFLTSSSVSATIQKVEVGTLADDKS